MRHALIVAFATTAFLAGCDAPHVTYPAGPELAKCDEAGKKQVTATLDELFGSVDAPRVPAGCTVDAAKVARGRTTYRAMCVACHGYAGDGDGPAAPNLDPRPRDFRMGTFKFTSTLGGAKPVREDLIATLRRGIPLTKMPSFAAIDAKVLEDVVEYLVFLASRGEVERRLAATWEQDGELEKDAASEAVGAVSALWEKAHENVLVPPGSMPPITPDLIARGKKIFEAADTTKCSGCHGADGKGYGSSAEGLKDDWGQPIRPRDLTLAIYRNGSRPADLYRTICCGVKGTPMPAFGGTLKPEEIWAAVAYVKSLGAKGSPVW